MHDPMETNLFSSKIALPSLPDRDHIFISQIALSVFALTWFVAVFHKHPEFERLHLSSP